MRICMDPNCPNRASVDHDYDTCPECQRDCLSPEAVERLRASEYGPVACQCCQWPLAGRDIDRGKCHDCAHYCATRSYHLVFIREHYPWGNMPTLRRPDGTLEFHVTPGEVITDREVLRARILDDWRPPDLDGQNLYCKMAKGGAF